MGKNYLKMYYPAERKLMDITKDIQPMTVFRNHSAEIMRHLKDTKRPVVLTVNGKAAAVVQDAEAYQQLLDLAAQASGAEGIRQGLDDLMHGRTWLAGDVFDEFRAEYGIPR
jgi:prevent-host-death family protein